MKFEGTGLKPPVTPRDLYWSLFVATSADAIQLMMDVGWDMTAENMAFMINTGGLALPAGNFARMLNCFFYSKSDERLRTRRIQWIDFLPLAFEPAAEDSPMSMCCCGLTWNTRSIMMPTCSFRGPRSSRTNALALLNRFRELIHTPDITEPKITSWLGEPAHQFILRMALPAVGLLGQRKASG
jgi:hypothetical protein